MTYLYFEVGDGDAHIDGVGRVGHGRLNPRVVLSLTRTLTRAVHGVPVGGWGGGVTGHVTGQVTGQVVVSVRRAMPPDAHSHL